MISVTAAFCLFYAVLDYLFKNHHGSRHTEDSLPLMIYLYAHYLSVNINSFDTYFFLGYVIFPRL